MRSLTFILLITLTFSLKLSDILNKSFERNKIQIIREEQEPKNSQEKDEERERPSRNRGPYRSPRNITLIPPSEFDEFEYNRRVNFSEPRPPKNSTRGPYRSPRNITLIPPSELDEFEYNRHINFSEPRKLTLPRFSDEENEGEESTKRKRMQKRFDKEGKNERRGERRQRREKREQDYNEEEIGEQRARGPGKKRKNMRGRFGIN